MYANKEGSTRVDEINDKLIQGNSNKLLNTTYLKQYSTKSV
jgi:hypothetical protein